MKQSFVFILAILFLASCSSKTEKKEEQLDDQEIEIVGESSKVTYDKILGERIDGPANVRDAINGKIILELYDGALVETGPEQKDWYLIGLNVSLTEKQLEEFKIYPNTDLYSVEGKKIGKTKDTVELWMSGDKSGIFGGYTHKDNIKEFSIPEIALQKEIEKGNLTLSALKNFISAYDFQDFGGNEELQYKQYFIYESIVVDPSPRDRITLLFDAKDNLIGVIHSRKLNLKNYKTVKLARGHSLTVIADLDKKEIKRITKERINFYNSID